MTLINFLTAGIVNRVPAVEALTPRLLADIGLDRCYREPVSGALLLSCFDRQLQQFFRGRGRDRA
jgi:hypothetical protein